MDYFVLFKVNPSALLHFHLYSIKFVCRRIPFNRTPVFPHTNWFFIKKGLVWSSIHADASSGHIKWNLFFSKFEHYSSDVCVHHKYLQIFEIIIII